MKKAEALTEDNKSFKTDSLKKFFVDAITQKTEKVYCQDGMGIVFENGRSDKYNFYNVKDKNG